MAPTKPPRPRKPGWGIIDRYMPDATPEAQEEAYENLRSLVKLLMQIDDRLYQEEDEKRSMPQPPLLQSLKSLTSTPAASSEHGRLSTARVSGFECWRE